jgi:hypothetical protein
VPKFGVLIMRNGKFSKQALAIIILMGINIYTHVIFASIRQDNNERIHTVNYCELIENAELYNNKYVRVKAIYTVGFESSILYHNDCEGKGSSENQMWVKFNHKYEQNSKPTICRRFKNLLKRSAKFNKYGISEVEVVFVGKFDGIKQVDEMKSNDEIIISSSGYGHLNSYDYQITVISIENVKVVKNHQ